MKNRTRRQVHPQSRRVVLPTIEILEERRAPAAFIVTSAADTGGGTLRDAITQSNATDGPNTITFAIGSGGVQTITLASALPALTQPVSIFGGSQTSTTYTSPGIVLNGAAVTGDGFDVYGGTSTIEGFIIQGFHGHGVVLATNGSDEVINDAIGTNSAETAAVANTSDGVLINNVGSNAIQNCVISGNHFNGIEVTGASAASNLIGKGPTANDGVGILTGGGDLIGLNFSGTAAIANLLDGILIHNSANLTTMTSDVVSGNTGNGIHITGTGAVASGVGTTGNSILASYIGTNLAGTAKIGNGADGILIDVGANNNNIGDGTTANTNIISGNVGNGIHMTGSGAVAANLGTTGNTVEANLIGTDVTGKVALGNTGDGILLDGGANNNTIGAAGSVNVISANHNGVHITGMGAGALVGSGTEGNTLVGNYIGTDITGAAKLGNTKDGVLIDNGANSNTIGDGTNADANIISGNGGNGIHITGTGSSAANTTTTANLVEGNFIGTDLTGKIALGNVDDGVLLENGANYNAIGVSGSINVISANGKSGIEITGTGPVSLGVGTVGNSVITNYIGTDVTGAAALGNTADGVLIDSGANENTIGDGTTANANVISANLGNGVHISGLGTGNSNANIGTQQNTVEGNLIGTDFTGTVALGNINDGVLIDTSANNNSIGSDGTVNVISGNHNNGVEIAGIGQGNPGTGTQGNTLLDNYIGTDITGEAKLGNTGDGVVINNGANGNTIGDGSADGINVIAGNGGNGIHMDGSNLVLTNGRLGTVKNSVLDNYIGTDLTGGAALGNTGDGILVNNGASGNTIGSDSTANVISGNVKNGIEIAGATTTGNTAIGNFIGVDATGALALGNTLNGVLISTGANANKIGDDNVGGSNIISANGANGVYIAGTGLVTAGTGTTGNVLLQNYIGTDSTGHFPLGNTAEGVLIDNGANANKIGDGTAGGVNVIAANTGDGIHLDGSGLVITTGKVGTENNVIAENYIGLDVSASVATGNGGDGILIDHGATNNTIGSATSHNVISGNTKNGVHITGTGVGAIGTGTTGNTLLGNYIGTNSSGLASSIGNTLDGVLIDGGANATKIGDGSAGGANVLSGNRANGIAIDGAGSSGNTILGDLIGTTADGASAAGNTLDGIFIDNGASGNTIGSATSHNIISGNTNGVHFAGSATTGNTVINSYIGTDVAGTVALANTNDGVLIDTGANGNTIGAVSSHNVISGNGANGVHITGAGAGAAGTGTTNNTLLANYIGTDATGIVALGNLLDGVLIDNGANANHIGNGAATGANVLSGNGANGVHIDGGNLTLLNGQVGTANNTVQSNYIGTDNTGAKALSNGSDGVLIENGATGNSIGSASSHNVISGNTTNGVEITGSTTTGNLVLGNYIGPDKSGIKSLGNGANGVLLAAGANANTIGGIAAGNILSGNTANGIQIDGSATTLNNVLGNYIGADSTGKVALPNAEDGILISGGAHANKIGSGTTTGANIISGNTGNGIDIIGGSNSNLVQGNAIGASVTGTALGNAGSGIYVDSSSNNILGGEAAGAGNVIQFNLMNGITIASGTGNSIQQNSIYSNGTGYLGIDLNNDGPTQNTPGGATSGANNDQNYPVITSAIFGGTLEGTTVTFTFNGTPNTQFQVELFDSPTANSLGYGEGKTPLTPTPISITTDVNGNATGTAKGLIGAPIGSVISATATDPGLDTSEFSQTVVQGTTQPATVSSAPPVVENVTFAKNARNQTTGVIFTFNVPLSASTVNASNIELFSAGAHSLYTTPIKLAKVNPVVYSAASNTYTVTVTTLHPLPAGHFIKAVVNGSTSPVENASGTALDGEYTSTLPSGNGVAGGDFDALIGYGAHLVYKDDNANVVTLNASHGSIMELIRPFDNAPGYLELAKVISGKTILSGNVRGGKTGTGTTTLEGIVGLGGAIDKLSSAKFTVVNPSITTLGHENVLGVPTSGDLVGSFSIAP